MGLPPLCLEASGVRSLPVFPIGDKFKTNTFLNYIFVNNTIDLLYTKDDVVDNYAQ
jgi:hypothetical protein